MRDHPPWIWALALVGGVTLLRLFPAALAELAPDEAYYWLWSRHLAPAYLDHPPAIALLIYIGTLVAPGELGVRLGVVALGAMTAMVIFAFSRRALWPARSDLALPLVATALAITHLLISSGGFMATPDAPLALAWSLGLWGLVRLPSRSGWALVGLAYGLGAWAKATMLLFPLVLLLALALHGRLPGRKRDMLFALPPALLALVQMVVGSDMLAFQARRVGHEGQGGLGGMMEYIGGQVGLMLPFLALGVGLFVALAWRRCRHEWGLAVMVANAVALPAFFLFVSLGTRVEANWPAMAYLTALPGVVWALAVWLGPQRAMGWVRIVLGASVAVTLVVHLQLLYPFLPLSSRLDPTARMRGWRLLAGEVRAHLERLGLAGPVIANRYQVAAALAFYGGWEQVGVVGGRESQIDLWGGPRAGLYVTDGGPARPGGLEDYGGPLELVIPLGGGESRRAWIWIPPAP